jgi:hypothetical protein
MLSHTTFNTTEYTALLSHFRSAGYRFDLFGDRPEAEGVCYLRHDVDFDLKAAVAIGALEADLGIASTFFVLMSTPFYNCLESDARAALKTLLDQGHEVGLHFDITAGHVGEDYDSAMRREAELLGYVTGRTCRIVSFHRPAETLLGGPDTLAGMVSTYGKAWFSDITYSSDSRGAWRYGHPTTLDAFKSGKSIQLLTHPIWWAEPDCEPPEHRLRRFADQMDARTLAAIEANSSLSIANRDALKR